MTPALRILAALWLFFWGPVAFAQGLAGGNPNSGFKYTHIATATTTTIKTGPGVLGAVCLNTVATATVTIYDNTSATGNVIAVQTLSNADEVNCVRYLVAFNAGLTIVTSAAVDLTVAWF